MIVVPYANVFDIQARAQINSATRTASNIVIIIINIIATSINYKNIFLSIKQ